MLGILEQMSGCDLSDVPRGIDGCGIPVIAMPLGNTALAMANMADPHHLSDARRRLHPILKAMMAEPFMVAGTDRFCTKVMDADPPKAAIKTGAEGVYCGASAAWPRHLHQDGDGAGRACEVIMGSVLRHLASSTTPFRAAGKDHCAAGEELGRHRHRADPAGPPKF